VRALLSPAARAHTRDSPRHRVPAFRTGACSPRRFPQARRRLEYRRGARSPALRVLRAVGRLVLEAVQRCALCHESQCTPDPMARTGPSRRDVNRGRASSVGNDAAARARDAGRARSSRADAVKPHCEHERREARTVGGAVLRHGTPSPAFCVASVASPSGPARRTTGTEDRRYLGSIEVCCAAR
jgi:hypothetical protein